MPISLSCPGCKKTLKVADNLAGKRAKCPGCQTPITIPSLAAPQPAPPSPKKDEEDWGLAPLDDEPIQKLAPIVKRPAAPSTKPAGPAAKTSPANPPTPAAKAPIAKPPANDFDDLALAPFDDDLFPTASAAKPKPALVKPVAAKPAAPPTPAAAAKPKTPAAKPPSNEPDELFLAPLGDDLLPVTPPAKKNPAPGKPAAEKQAATSSPRRPAKIPIAKSADEHEEEDFNLQPLADLGSDLLGSFDPLGMAVPLSGNPLPNQANPYLAPQTSISSAATINGSLPVWKTAKECIRTYSNNFAYGILFGFKSMGVLLGLAAVVYVVFFIFGKVIENIEPTIDNIERVAYVFWGLIWLLGICWFLVQCWLLKGLLYFGYSIAKQDYNAAENALNSPGSLLQFILASLMNCLPIFAVYFALYSLVFATHWAAAIPAFLVLSATVNFLCLNLMFFYEYDVNCLTIFGYWSRIVVPNWLQYFLTVILCTMVGLVIQTILIFGVTMVFGLLKGSLQSISADPRIVALLAGSILYSVIYGIVGAYYAIMQGVCFRKMMRLYRHGDDDE